MVSRFCFCSVQEQDCIATFSGDAPVTPPPLIKTERDKLQATTAHEQHGGACMLVGGLGGAGSDRSAERLAGVQALRRN